MPSPSKAITGVLENCQASDAVVELLPKLTALLPHGTVFTDNIWNVIAWKRRRGNSKIFHLNFGSIRNESLREIAKLFILQKKLETNLSNNTAFNYLNAIKMLDQHVWMKSLRSLSNADFYATQNYIQKRFKTPHRICHDLQVLGKWLNIRIGLPISYVSTVRKVQPHGRKAMEEGREKKLTNTLVIRDMIEANTRDNLSSKDRFFLSAFTLLVATGFRINELATLPKNCLECRDGIYSIRYLAEKVRHLEVRYIPQDMVPAVQAALDYVIRITELGREAVSRLRSDAGFDWSEILKDQAAVEYFAKKFAHEWTSNPRNLMINPDGVWWNARNRIIDIIRVVEESGSKSVAARRLRTYRPAVDFLLVAQYRAREGKLPNSLGSRGKKERFDWDTDTRVISILRFVKHCGVDHKKAITEMYRHIIDEAKALQIQGKVYPVPVPQPELEAKYARKIRPVVEDGNGRSLLEPEDALFILPQYLFSEARGTKFDNYRLITDNTFKRWFMGERRSRGTGNHEDSCFVRLGIIDQSTGKHAKFSSHDVRHWLDTTYAEGHMDEQVIALIFSRKKGSNHTYDQTSKKKRLENIRQAIRDGSSVGHITENYCRLAEYSREDAEQYLLACTRMVNIMPHGACTLSWGMQACPNYLSCFAGDKMGGGCCEYLQIDPADEKQIGEVCRIEHEVAMVMSFMPEEAPQREHYKAIQQNIQKLLLQC